MTFEEAVDYLAARGLPDSWEGWQTLLPRSVGSLFGGYFHEDFPEDYGSGDDTVRAWLAEDGDDPSARNQVVQELQYLLDLQLPDEVLRQIGDRFLSCSYWPADDYNEWLRHVQQLIAEAPPFPDPDPLTVRDLDPE